jgi:hypothetical protein
MYWKVLMMSYALSMELKRYEVGNPPQSVGRKTAEENDNKLFPNLK